MRPQHAPKLLTTPIEKKEILAESGLDYAVFVTFTEALSRYEPRRFVEEILLGRLGVEELVVGYDHGFGRGRTGDTEALERIGAELGFDVDVVAPVHASGAPVSSSRIREAILTHRFGEATACLGRPYSIRGVVVRGDGRGRKLGFPTANLQIGGSDKLIPPAGIYAVRASLGDYAHAGALHIGPRPTFKGSPPTIELHLLDFAEDIYGDEIRVDFVEYLREVKPFANVQALVDQLREDVETARRVVVEPVVDSGGA